jgi:hypothetical protein
MLANASLDPSGDQAGVIARDLGLSRQLTPAEASGTTQTVEARE